VVASPLKKIFDFGDDLQQVRMHKAETTTSRTRMVLPLIQHSRDLVQLFIEGEAARALVRRVAGIFVNVDRTKHSRKFNLIDVGNRAT